VSLDGSSLDVADTAENGASFGYPGSSRGESAFPKLRFAALVENGTHVLFGARLGCCADGETTLAHDVVPALRPGMLCLADRQFFGYGPRQGLVRDSHTCAASALKMTAAGTFKMAMTSCARSYRFVHTSGALGNTPEMLGAARPESKGFSVRPLWAS